MHLLLTPSFYPSHSETKSSITTGTTAGTVSKNMLSNSLVLMKTYFVCYVTLPTMSKHIPKCGFGKILLPS